MDKNMIKIDDLVRQRLTGGEEEERPGAWLHMREMLDNKMPAGAVGGGYNWRRTFTYASALLLLAATCVGGYKMKLADNNTNDITDNSTTKTVMHVARPYNAHKVTGNHSLAAGNHKPLLALADNGLKKNGTAAETTDNNTNHSKPDEHVYASAGKTLTVNKKTVRELTASGTAGLKHKDRIASNKSKITSPTAPAFAAKDVQNISTANTPGGPSDVTAIAAVDNAGTRRAKNKLANAATRGTKHSAINNQSISPSNILAGSIAATTGSNNQKISVTAKDSIEEYQVVNHYRKATGAQKGGYYPDTVAMGKKEVTRTAELPILHFAGLPVKKQALLASTRPMNNDLQRISDEEILAAASQNETKAGSSKKGSLFMAKMEEMLDQVKENMGQMRFHPGLIAGANATFGSNSFAGFQLGATGEFTVSQHLSLMLELKYIHHFNNGTVFNDNYSTYTAPLPNTWEKDSVLRSFSFSTLHTVELPLSIRYAIGDFTIFAGANLVYNFAINHSENDGSIKGSLNTGNEPGNAVSGQPKLTNSDFASQLAAGYLVGLGYRITPAVQFDVRLTQTFWDNAKTTGAQTIANDFYRSPSVQLSVGYRFGNTKKLVAR